jgi:hypothetical protein
MYVYNSLSYKVYLHLYTHLDKPALDVLNAAQSAGLAMNLDHELDYLLPALKNLPGIDYNNDWKLINMQIGSK